ncbi:P pilus assembly protein, pilin FimA [Serratia fonticola]|uniref:hypothetical protein n=1 Tax=Serratia fonticola TaxID=47917 RepID=UPI0021828040|nr:hypothetical protein [Serratia fonticola]CAI2158533.1 P pilus assembly protein, pilin FimA [Serratia fonticola]
MKMNSFLSPDVRNGKSLILIPSLMALLISSPVHSANDKATTKISGRVLASCSVEIPSTIVFKDIQASDLVDKEAGTKIDGYDKELEIKAACLGGGKYKLTFTPSNYSASLPCIETRPKEVGLNICVSHETDILDFQGGKKPVLKELDSQKVKLTLAAQIASKNQFEAGQYTASLEVEISPM